MGGTSTIGRTGQQVYRDDKLEYGVGSSYTTCTIKGMKFIPTSIPVQTSGELKEYKDNTGVICSIVVPETFQTISISGYLVTGSASEDLKLGDEIKGLPVVQGMKQGVHWRINDFTVNWQNEEVASISATVKSYTF